MVLEATLIVLDNSEFMRNGDYTPTRLEAQADAVQLLFNAKTQSNPENTVGLMTMAGKGPEVLVTPTADLGRILNALHNLRPQGKVALSHGIQVAQLALKHRPHKNHRQRVVVFVASPVDEDERALVKLAKKLKKNNIAVDVVNFGQEQENAGKLEAFIEAVNSGDNSHILTVPPGPHILSDVLISSAIVAGEDGAPMPGANAASFEFGVDPSMDPELALALRISMEEERARQEAATGKPAAETKAPAASAAAKPAVVADEDDMLAQAIAMSMMHAQEDVAMTDAAKPSSSSTSTVQDPSFMSSVLGSLPGVNPEDPRIKNALQQQKPSSSPKKDEGKSSPKKEQSPERK